jgi:hypothetical protein
MKRTHAPTLVGIIGIAEGLMIMFAFPIGKVEPAIPTIKVPGAYPYEETVRIPAPESAALPVPAPFPYQEPTPSVVVTQDRDSRTSIIPRPLTAEAVRRAAFKYNGVPRFCGFLAALPADVSVYDPNLGRSRALVKGGHVVRKNATWLRTREQAGIKRNDRTLVSVEELRTQKSGI